MQPHRSKAVKKPLLILSERLLVYVRFGPRVPLPRPPTAGLPRHGMRRSGRGHNRTLPGEDASARLGKPEAAEAPAISKLLSNDMAGCLKLPTQRNPPPTGTILPDTEGGKPIVTELSNPVGTLTKQNIDEVMRAEALTRTNHRGQKLLCRHGHVFKGNLTAADIAGVAVPGMLLIEVGEEPFPSAYAALDV